MISIFKKQIITNTEIVNFWSSNSFDQEVREYRNKNYQITRNNTELLIHAKNENVFLNPKQDFLQARIDLRSTNTKRNIIVEPKVFIERLYIGLSLGLFLFFLLNLKDSILVAFILLTIFSLILYYNYHQINKAILTFKNDLEDPMENE